MRTTTPDGHGHTAGDVPTGGADVTRGRGVATSFGSVAVLGAARRTRPGPVTHAEHQPNGPAATTSNEPWSDLVDVEVEVHNGLARAILVSPGQFRLRLGENGPTVAPYDFDTGVRELAPQQRVRTTISYLAPTQGATALNLMYEDTGQAGSGVSTPAVLVLALSNGSTAEVRP